MSAASFPQTKRDDQTNLIAMTRKLKYHETRLLRKHDFIGFNKADSHRDANVIRRYMIQDRNDYVSGAKYAPRNHSPADAARSTNTTEYVAYVQALIKRIQSRSMSR
jgi:hypothetical protein